MKPQRFFGKSDSLVIEPQKHRKTGRDQAEVNKEIRNRRRRHARLCQVTSVCARIQELRRTVTATVLQLAIAERDNRLLALQERFATT
jgi:hypothetical protein